MTSIEESIWFADGALAAAGHVVDTPESDEATRVIEWAASSVWENYATCVTPTPAARTKPVPGAA